MKTLLILLLSSITLYSFPANKWSHLSTEHFVFSYNEQTKHLVKKAAQISEAIYDTLTEYFDYDKKLSKISIVLRDDYDYSNGGAYIYMPLVEIECRKTQWEWRGEQNWLNVALTHELSHVFTIRMLKKPVVFNLSASIYSDVLKGSGYVVSQPDFANLPTWFVEGIAQLGSFKVGADKRDPFREMILRDAFFSGSILTLDQMSRFEGSAKDYELAYNQGFDFLLYLTENGENSKIITLCHSVQVLGVTAGFREVYGVELDDLYAKWKDDLKKRFKNEDFRSEQGDQLIRHNKGVFSIQTDISDDYSLAVGTFNHSGKRLDIYTLEDGKPYKQFAEDVGPLLKKDSAGGIYYTKLSLNPLTGSENYDIYRDKKRLTYGMRCLAFDVKGDDIAAVKYNKGITTVTKRINGKWIDETSYGSDTAVYSICMIDKKRMIVGLGTGTKQTFLFKDTAGTKSLWSGIKGDILDPSLVSGDTILFVSTVDGSPQVYLGFLDNDSVWYKVTNVPGGVRYPAIVNNNGTRIIRYSLYSNGSSLLFEQPFDLSKYQHILLKNDSIEPIKITNVDDKPVSLYNTTMNIVRGYPTFSIGYDYYQFGDKEYDQEDESALSSTVDYFVMNASGDYSWEVTASAFRDFSKVYVNKPDYSLSSTISADIYKTKNSLSFSYGKSFYEDSRVVGDTVPYLSLWENSRYSCIVKSDFQLTLNNFLRLSWKISTVDTKGMDSLFRSDFHWLRSGTQTYRYDFNNIYTLNVARLMWNYYRSSPRLYGMLLGNDWKNIYLDFVHNITDCSDEYYDSSSNITGLSSFRKLSFGASSTKVYLRNTASLGAWWDISVSDGAFVGGKQNPLSGNMISSFEFGADVRWAPLVQDNRISEWYRKWALCAGVVRMSGRLNDNDSYVSGGYLEFGIRNSFFLHNRYESLFYLNVHKDFTSFSNKDVDPYSIYFGLQL